MRAWLLAVIATALLVPGCLFTRHKIELEIKPIHATIDINLKIDKQLDDFFDDIEKEADEADKKLSKETPKKKAQ